MYKNMIFYKDIVVILINYLYNKSELYINYIHFQIGNFKLNRNNIVFSNYMDLEPKTLTYMDQCTPGMPFLQTDFL